MARKGLLPYGAAFTVETTMVLSLLGVLFHC